MSEAAPHRYPGPQYFRDDDLDRVLFQGRGAEATRLLHLTLAEDIVVLYAKSGTGKTSLINTKLLPPLRERQFLPVVARVRDTSCSPAAAIFSAIRATAGAAGLELVDGNPTSLLSYFRTLEVWRGDLLLTPVLILDQFEELFTVRTPEVRDAFARELAALRGRSASPAAEGGEGPEDLDGARAPVKLVLSLREDSIGELEELSAFMPDVLRHRFRLGPLSEAEARDAIIEPAKLTDARLSTPAFEWKSDTVERLLAFLHQRRLAGRVFTSHHVEPFQLQLICRHVEDQVAARHRAGRPLTPIDYTSDVGGDAGAQRIMRGFYEEQLAALAGTYSLRQMRRLCEEGLITAAGRRAILDEGTIGKKYKLGEDALEALSGRHLIRAEPRGDDKRYELTHDTLVAPILEVRAARRARGVRSGVLLSAASLLALAVAAFLALQSDRFQEWAAIREGTKLVRALSGEGDNVIQPWSLAIGWSGDPERAREAANAIEQPAFRIVALTRLGEALAMLDARANGSIVEESLDRAVSIASRVQEPAERTRRLLDVATTAESLERQPQADRAWAAVEQEAPDLENVWAVVSMLTERRASRAPASPGLDRAVDRVTSQVVEWLEQALLARLPEDIQVADVVSVAGRLLDETSDANASRVAIALQPVLERFSSEPDRTYQLARVAAVLVDRGLSDQAAPLIDRAERLATGVVNPRDRLTVLVRIARALRMSGPVRAGAALRRVRELAANDAAPIDWNDLWSAADVLSPVVVESGGPPPVFQPGVPLPVQPDAVDLLAAATDLRLTGFRKLIRQRSAELTSAAPAISRLSSNVAAPIMTGLSQAAGPSPGAVAAVLWIAGDRDAAMRAVAAVRDAMQSYPLAELAALLQKDGRPVIDRLIEVAAKDPDRISRGTALASAMTWFIRFAPEEFDRALKLVGDERNSLARQAMLEALTLAIRNPSLAGQVVGLLGTLPPPQCISPEAAPPIADSAGAGDREPEYPDPADRAARECQVRVGLAEGALTTMVAAEGGELVPEVFATGAAAARRLEGPSRAEWLGKLGVLAARGGRFAEARQLAAESGDPVRRLAVLTAIVAVRAGRRAPAVSGRIYEQLLPLVERSGPGGSF